MPTPSPYLIRRPLAWGLVLYAALLWAFQDRLARPDALDPSHAIGAGMGLVGVVAAPPDRRPKGTVLIVEAESVQGASRARNGRLEPRSARGPVLVQAARIDDAVE